MLIFFVFVFFWHVDGHLLFEVAVACKFYSSTHIHIFQWHWIEKRMHSSGCSCHTQWHSIKSKDNIQGFYQQRWRFQQSHSSISLLGHVNGSIQEPNRFISIQYSAGIPIYSVNNPHTQINCFIHRTWTVTFVIGGGYSGQIMLTWRDITNVLLNATPTKWTNNKKKDPVLSQDQGLQSSVSY